jgi:hypothetical protein
MADEIDLQELRQWLHDLNNRVGVILALSELLQLEQLSPKAAERTRIIEEKTLEVRELLQKISDRYVR